MTLKKTLVRGRIFNPLSRLQWDYHEDGAFIVDSDGRIEAIGEYAQLKTAPGIEQALDFSAYLILPGLIDVHIHLPQLPIRGKVAGSLLDWLNQYAFPIEEAFANPTYAGALSRQFFQSLAANGTTTALVLSSVHEESTHVAFECAEESGMRVVMGKVMMDQYAPPSMLETTDDSVAASRRLAQAWHGKNQDLLRYAFTPRFALSCSQALLEATGELHRQFAGSYIHSHLAENPHEVEQVEALYGKKGLSYTEVYERTGCLGPRTILAHGLYLSSQEMAILRDTQTRIAHCPTSNFFLKSGFFNLSAFWEYQIPFALGSDVGGGPDLSLFRVMRSMDEMQLHHRIFVKPTEALYYGTLAGAEALSLDNETGNLLPGKSADFIVVDIDALNTLHTAAWPIEEMLSQLIYLGTDAQIVKTYVRGKEVYASAIESRSTRLNVPQHPQQQRQ